MTIFFIFLKKPTVVSFISTNISFSLWIPCSTILILFPTTYSLIIYWESQFLGRLTRSLGSLRRERSGVLEETGIWNSQGGGKDKHLFFSTFLSLSHIKHFFSLSQELMITQQMTLFKLCTKDYVKTMYSAWGQFLLPENLLANPVILKCKLWEWF